MTIGTRMGSGFGSAGWLFAGEGGGDGVEAEFLRRWCRGGDELFDGLEDELELLIVVGVFFFEGFDFLGEESVGVHQAPELDEGAHDGDVHLHGAGGMQHAGEHGDTLLGEGVGEGTATAPGGSPSG